jgi:hypothetical protein
VGFVEKEDERKCWGISMAFDTFVKCVRNGGMCMYFVCDFNGKQLKNLNIVCCVSILLTNVEGM